MEGTSYTVRSRRSAFLRVVRQTAMVAGVLMAGALMYGCQPGDGNDPLSADGKESRESFRAHQLRVREAPNKVHLPKGNQKREILSVTDSVNAERGGHITLSSTFSDTGNKPVSIMIRLTFPPGALSQSTNITVSLDTTDLMTNITFGPHGTTFNTPVLLDVKVSGFDFTDYVDGTVDAWYVDQGLWVEMLQSRKIVVSPTLGTLDAKDVELHHFSRYAFGR